MGTYLTIGTYQLLTIGSHNHVFTETNNTINTGISTLNVKKHE